MAAAASSHPKTYALKEKISKILYDNKHLSIVFQDFRDTYKWIIMQSIEILISAPNKRIYLFYCSKKSIKYIIDGIKHIMTLFQLKFRIDEKRPYEIYYQHDNAEEESKIVGKLNTFWNLAKYDPTDIIIFNSNSFLDTPEKLFDHLFEKSSFDRMIIYHFGNVAHKDFLQKHNFTFLELK